jgi:hypothetical protein
MDRGKMQSGRQDDERFVSPLKEKCPGGQRVHSLAAVRLVDELQRPEGQSRRSPPVQ